MLVQAGADLEARDSDGNTPLNVNWMGLPDVAAALIAAGADVDSQNDEMETPLMTNKSLKAVQLLLKAGANPRIPNRRGLNALDVARSDIFAHDIATEIERWMLTHPAKK
jgi:ankyrin repeat protein